MATDTAKIRFLLRDPDGASPDLTDADIQTALEIESNLYKAAALCARNLAAKYAPKADLGAGGASVKNSQKHKHYMGLATAYEVQAAGQLDGCPQLAGVSLEEMEAAFKDDDRPTPAFRRGQFDYP